MVSKLQAVQERIEWWTKSHECVLDGVQVEFEESCGFKVVAERDIEAEEVLMTAAKMKIEKEHDGVKLFELGLKMVKSGHSKRGENLPQHFALLSFLLIEFGKGEASEIAPYFTSWPSLATVKESFPQFWSEEDLDKLSGTLAYVMCKQQVAAVEAALLDLLQELEGKITLRDGFESLLEQSSYVLSCFQARCITSSDANEKSVVVPVLDLCNGSYASRGNAKFKGNSSGTYSVVATKPIAAGEELLVGYMNSDTADLLLNFGYVPRETNPNQASMLFPFPKAFDGLSAKSISSFKQNFGPIVQHGVHPRQGFSLNNLYRTPPNVKLLQFLNTFDELDSTWGGLYLFRLQLDQFKASLAEDLRTVKDDSASHKSKLIAQVRIHEREHISRWAFRLSMEMGKRFDPHGGAANDGSSILGDFCCVCGSTLTLSRCGGCSTGVKYCSREHQIAHRKFHKAFCKPQTTTIKTLSTTSRSTKEVVSV